MAIVGNTIKITGKFVDFNGNPTLATEVKFVIFTQFGVVTEIPIASADEDGNYVTNYVVPSGIEPLYIKIYGMVNGYPETNIIIVPRKMS